MLDWMGLSFENGVLRIMDHEFTWGRLADLLAYQPDAPMLFSSGLFFFLFIGFSVFYYLLRKKMMARIIYVTLFSLYFYYKSSGLWFGLLVFTATSDFFIGHYLARATTVRARKALVTLSLCVNLGMLAYFKYFNFLLGSLTLMLNDLGFYIGSDRLLYLEFENWDIFLPVGISFFTFQSISYVIDIYRGRIEPLRRWIDYLFYVSFFPQLVAGPIVRARDFIPQIHRDPLVTREAFGEGLFLIFCGLMKKAVISDYISLLYQP